MAPAEQWVKWEPIKGLSKKYYIDSVIDNFDGFNILLSDEADQHQIKVTFETLVLSYRNTDESFRLSTTGFIHENYGKTFCTEWTFFKVIHSPYVQWLSEQSYGIAESVLPPIHFSFLAINSILDVIATCEPTFEFIKKDSKKIETAIEK